jgi:hypothetical protein
VLHAVVGAVEPFFDEGSGLFRGFLGGTMAYARKQVQLGVADVGAELDDRHGWNGDVGVAPDEKRRRWEWGAQELVEGGHVFVPGGKQAQEVRHGAAGLQIFAVWLEFFECV